MRSRPDFLYRNDLDDSHDPDSFILEETIETSFFCFSCLVVVRLFIASAERVFSPVLQLRLLLSLSMISGPWSMLMIDLVGHLWPLLLPVN